jgi:hypothetical protein
MSHNQSVSSIQKRRDNEARTPSETDRSWRLSANGSLRQEARGLNGLTMVMDFTVAGYVTSPSHHEPYPVPDAHMCIQPDILLEQQIDHYVTKSEMHIRVSLGS